METYVANMCDREKIENKLGRTHFQKKWKSVDIFKASKNARSVLRNCKRKWWGKYWINILLYLLVEVEMITGNLEN